MTTVTWMNQSGTHTVELGVGNEVQVAEGCQVLLQLVDGGQQLVHHVRQEAHHLQHDSHHALHVTGQ